MKSNNWILVTMCICAVIQSNCMTEQIGFPAIKPSQFWINSIPSGLPCYVSRESSSIFVPDKLKGKTPLLLELEAGHYYIGLSLPKGADPDAEFTTRFISGEELISSSDDKHDYVAYGVEKSTNRSTFIGLAFDSDLALDALAKFYPSTDNFTFDEQKVRELLSSKGVKQEDIESNIKLLRRGGKIVIKTDKGCHHVYHCPIMIEIKPDRTLYSWAW